MRWEQMSGKVEHRENRMAGPHDGRRYAAGDTVRLNIALVHKANLKEVRVVFAHGNRGQSLMGRGKPRPISAISDRAPYHPMSSILEAEITIPRGATPGVYKLDRISYETEGGQLGHLAAEEELQGTEWIAFEVVREAPDTPVVADIEFTDG
jgi:hypothetical protein